MDYRLLVTFLSLGQNTQHPQLEEGEVCFGSRFLVHGWLAPGKNITAQWRKAAYPMAARRQTRNQGQEYTLPAHTP